MAYLTSRQSGNRRHSCIGYWFSRRYSLPESLYRSLLPQPAFLGYSRSSSSITEQRCGVKNSHESDVLGACDLPHCSGHVWRTISPICKHQLICLVSILSYSDSRVTYRRKTESRLGIPERLHQQISLCLLG